MALTKASLSNKLKTELQAVFDIVDATRLQKFCDAAASAIVDEFQSNAKVEPGTFAVSTAPGPVTGEGIIT